MLIADYSSSAPSPRIRIELCKDAEKKAARGTKDLETRTAWTPEVKLLCLEAVKECHGNKAKALREIKKIYTKDKNGAVCSFDSISWQMLYRWRKAVLIGGDEPFADRGRKVQKDFELEVLSRLIFVSLEDNKDPDDQQDNLQVIANVAFTYECVKSAAEEVQKSEKWKNDKGVQRLTFSHGWIKNFMDRFTLARRAITNKDKLRPSVPEVQARMEELQALMDELRVKLKFVFNGDESGVWYGTLPLYIYVPEGTKRGSAPASDDRSRFTVFFWSDAEGTPCPVFIIIKCSVKKADLSGTRVIDHLHEQKGFTATDGWKLQEWEGTFKLGEDMQVFSSICIVAV